MSSRPFKKARRLVRSNGTYWYKVGHGSCVIAVPSGSKHVVNLYDLTGRSPDLIERGRWKISSDGMITPKDVADYITRKNL